jgi:hypothetical protein
MASRKAVTVALAGSVLGADPTGVPLFEQPVRHRTARPQPVRRQAAHREYTLFRTIRVAGDPDGDGVAVSIRRNGTPVFFQDIPKRGRAPW